MKKVLTLIILAGFSTVNAQSDPVVRVASKSPNVVTSSVIEPATVPFKNILKNKDKFSDATISPISPFIIKLKDHDNLIISDVLYAIEVQEEGRPLDEEGGKLELQALYAPEVQEDGKPLDEEGGKLNLPALYAQEVQEEGKALDEEGGKLNLPALYAQEVQEEGMSLDEEGGKLNLPALYAQEVQEEGMPLDEEGGKLNLPALYAQEVQEEGMSLDEEGGKLELQAMTMKITPNDFTIAPTASTDIINVTSKIEGVVKIVVVSMSGEVKLIDRFIDRYEIDITDYAKGIYVVRVTQGKSITTTKFLKQ